MTIGPSNTFRWRDGEDSVPALRASVTAGSTSSIYLVRAPATIFVNPGSGGTMTCQVRIKEGGTLIDADADNASFAADTVFTLNSPVYEVRFGATTQDGVGEVACL